MPRKKTAPRRDPTPEEEGAQILEAASKAGADYAMEQVGSEHFRDWVYDQMLEAERMRKADPSSVFPADTPAGAKRAARNMLQQLEWDTKRQMDQREVLDLSGAKGVFESGSESWVRDTYGITVQDVTSAFFDSFAEELNKPSTRDWLAEEVLTRSQELRGGSEVSEARRRLTNKSKMTRSDGTVRERRRGLPIRWERSSGGTGWRGTGASGRTYLLRPAGGDRWNLHMQGVQFGPFGTIDAAIADANYREKNFVKESPRIVRDFIAVDTSGRTIAGPSKDYAAMKREAEKRRGYVKFAMERLGNRRR